MAGHTWGWPCDVECVVYVCTRSARQLVDTERMHNIFIVRVHFMVPNTHFTLSRTGRVGYALVSSTLANARGRENNLHTCERAHFYTHSVQRYCFFVVVMGFIFMWKLCLLWAVCATCWLCFLCAAPCRYCVSRAKLWKLIWFCATCGCAHFLA